MLNISWFNKFVFKYLLTVKVNVDETFYIN